jgi:hypothetical protein
MVDGLTNIQGASRLCSVDFLKCSERDLLVATLDAHHHLVLVPDGHLQFHRLVLLHDGARSANVGIQQGLKLLIAIGGKIQSAIVGRDCERDAPGQAGRGAVFVRCRCGRSDPRRRRSRTCLQVGYLR